MAGVGSSWAGLSIGAAGDPAGEAPLIPHFPDIVLRARQPAQTPSLQTYLGRLPRAARHYGGYYAMTPENWPLIGPHGHRPAPSWPGALSGFGTMAGLLQRRALRRLGHGRRAPGLCTGALFRAL